MTVILYILEAQGSQMWYFMIKHINISVVKQRFILSELNSDYN